MNGIYLLKFFPIVHFSCIYPQFFRCLNKFKLKVTDVMDGLLYFISAVYYDFHFVSLAYEARSRRSLFEVYVLAN